MSRVPPFVRSLFVTCAIVGVAVALVRFAGVPNPAPICLLAVVVGAFIAGWAGGLFASTLTVAYASMTNPVSFNTLDSVLRITVIAVVSLAMTAIVATLKSRLEVVAARASETRYRAFFELAAAGASEVDSRTRKFVRANRKLAEITGYSQDELRRMTFSELTHPDDRARDLETYLAALERREPYEIEKRYVCKDGTIKWVHVNVRVVDAEPAPYTVAIVLDITEARKARAEAEAASRAKDEFLSVVSHELRTPMTSVLGWAGLLVREDLDDETRALGNRMLLESARLEARLIDDLLDLARAEAGKLHFRTQRLEIGALVRSACDTVRSTASELGQALRIETPPEPLYVDGDDQRLRQVVWNVVGNAVKFTPRRGAIDVRVEADPADAVIRVKDSGPGIAPEFLPRLFDWFTQEQSSTTRAYGGLGLGLAIVRQIVQMHGGTIEAHSEGKTRGAEFVIKLPRAAEGVVEAEEQAVVSMG